MPIYFAYGSNLSSRRLRERIGEAEPLGAARLKDFELVCDKLGADGSAKANLAIAPGAVVFGALYRVTEPALVILDGFEGGYDRTPLRVHALAGSELQVITYRSQLTSAHARPYTWYRDLILDGAHEHELPEPYVRAIAAWPVHPDPTTRPTS